MRKWDKTYTAGEVTMEYTESGASSDHTFVLIHGIGMGRSVFDRMAEALAEHGRVIALDLPGFGDSPEPGSVHSIETTAGVIAEFIARNAPGPVVLVGHSMGTQIAAELAVTTPELVEYLVLIAPTVNRHERTARRQALRMMQDLSGESPKVLALGAWEYVQTTPMWFARKLRFMLDHHIEEICPSIEAETLVLRGEHDRVCPREWVCEVAGAIPHARMQEIPGRGHEAVIKSAEPVASMILGYISQGPARTR